MDFLRLFQHLLPDGRAWRTTINKRLRQFFQGLTVIPEGVKGSADSVWADISPDTTEKLAEWERQFGLPGNVVDEASRRDRLSATWRSLVGGQSPRYIEDTLRAAGFDVYVHEWWDPSTLPVPGTSSRELDQKQCGETFAECGEVGMGASALAYPLVRNPFAYLRGTSAAPLFLVECGEAFAECGEADMEAGNSLAPSGYPLVNKLASVLPDYTTLCGEATAECGEATAECGAYVRLVETPVIYQIPDDEAKWPYFLYIGGETFGELAQVDPKRRDEFEALCLKICPCHLWLGILVEFV
jgi:hypothetical protein